MFIFLILLLQLASIWILPTKLISKPQIYAISILVIGFLVSLSHRSLNPSLSATGLPSTRGRVCRSSPALRRSVSNLCRGRNPFFCFPLGDSDARLREDISTSEKMPNDSDAAHPLDRAAWSVTARGGELKYCPLGTDLTEKRFRKRKF